MCVCVIFVFVSLIFALGLGNCKLHSFQFIFGCDACDLGKFGQDTISELSVYTQGGVALCTRISLF